MTDIYRVAVHDVTRGERDFGYPVVRHLLPVYGSAPAAQLEADRLNNPDFGVAPKEDKVGWHFVEPSPLLEVADVKRHHRTLKAEKRKRAEAEATRLEEQAARLRAGRKLP